jgi:hypothetical protein
MQRRRKNTPAQNLVRDLTAPLMPRMVARDEAVRIQALAHDLLAGRISLAEAKAELRGAA